MTTSIFCDGGVISRNPSSIGGTWAVVLVGPDGAEVDRRRNVITPQEAGVIAVSNNYTELLAACMGLSLVPDGWAGALYTDSNVTRCRLLGVHPRMAGIPAALEEFMWAQRRRLGPFTVTLLGGHPTKDDLFRGVGKRGLPVSRWNVLCDKLCSAAARAYLATMEVPPQ